MADKMIFKIKEECQMDDDDSLCKLLNPDCTWKEEIKTEWEGPVNTADVIGEEAECRPHRIFRMADKMFVKIEEECKTNENETFCEPRNEETNCAWKVEIDAELLEPVNNSSLEPVVDDEAEARPHVRHVGIYKGADKAIFEIKNECLIDVSESWTEPPTQATDCEWKEENTTELMDRIKTVDDDHFVGGRDIKTEELDISDMEFPIESDSEDRTFPPTSIDKEIPSSSKSSAKSCAKSSSKSSAKSNAKSNAKSTFINNESSETQEDASLKRKTCEICKKIFANKHNLKSHMFIHDGIKPFQCSACEKCFNQKSNLKKHLAVHSSFKRYLCELCGKGFKLKAYLNYHIMKVHDKVTQFKCDVCQESFCQESDLKSHSLSHSELTYYKCEICQNCFRTKSKLKAHILSHSELKWFKCEICQESFGTKPDLKTHQLSHSKYKYHECIICEKTFTFERQLRAHVIKHFPKREEEKLSECPTCKKRFSSEHTLKIHSLTHASVKPYKCDVCDKEFTIHGRLAKHKKVIHETVKKQKNVWYNFKKEKPKKYKQKYGLAIWKY